jgi:hypothetical protein
MVEAQVLDPPPNLPNSGRISSKLGLRIDDADLYALQPFTAQTALVNRGKQTVSRVALVGASAMRFEADPVLCLTLSKLP